MLLDSVLSHRNVLETYNKASRFVTNWTLQQDYEPFEQLPEINPLNSQQEEYLGVSQSYCASAKELLDIKISQIDGQIPDQVNCVFNYNQCMFHVDQMGNLLSNLKLAFYENTEEKNFISKMFFDGNESATRDILVKSFEIIKEIYNDILLPLRQSQLNFLQDMNQQDIKTVKDLCEYVKIYGSIPEAKPQYKNLEVYFEIYPQNANVSLCSFFMDKICQVQFLKMSSSDYLKCLQGHQIVDKNQGIQNTQLLLKPKISNLKKILAMSKSEYEFDLINQIKFLQRINYNINLFGKFNPIQTDEEQIIIKMQSR